MNIESKKLVDEHEETVHTAAPPDEVVTESQLDEVVTEPVASVPAPAHEVSAQTETVRTVRTTRFTPSAVVGTVVAIAMMVIGGIMVGRAGLDGSLGEPVVTVAGYTATAVLGLIMFGFGAVLVIAALGRNRRVILGLGIIGGVASLIAIFEPTVGGDSLSIEREFAFWVAIAMAAVIVSALMPTWSSVSTRQTTEVT